tara:strand:+ start:729 stop:2261 length:1533 start_codon:yes stop_codon:yes gene_type:complete
LTFKINNKILLYIIPFFLGLITSFSLNPYNFIIINFITFPIFYIFFVNNLNKKKWLGFKIGWMFGFGYFISNLYWITNALTFDSQFKNLIPIALIVIPSYLALFYGLATLICSLFNLKKNFASILIFATVFSLIEYLRGFIFGGFPWNLSAYSWTSYTNFLQIISVIGTYSFNLLSITFFLIPSILFFEYKYKLKLLSLIFFIFLITLNYFYGSKVINDYKKNTNVNIKSNIKILSPKIKIERFYQNEDPSEIISELIELSNPNLEEETIFIFPEGTLTSINLNEIKIYKKMFKDNYSSKHKIILGINSIEKSKVFNSLVVLDNNLNILAKYNKNDLVPFGEFLPFENLLSKLGIKKITGGYQSFSADKTRKVLNINDLKFLPLICYEIIYSGRLNKGNNKYDFIINISEDGWFGNSIGPNQHFSHSIFRAIEEGKNLIRSANNGTSAVIDPTGQIINKLESTHKGVIEVNKFKNNKKTFFSIYGNNLFFYFILFYISLIFFLKKKKKGS